MAIRRLKRTVLLAAVLAAGAASLAWAGEWYARLDAGYSVDGAIETPTGDLDLENDWSGHGGLGYAFDNGFRVEAEGAYRENEFSDIPGDVNATAAMANLYYDFNREGAVRPYVGVGAGGAKIDVSGAAGPISFDDDDTVAAYQGMAGIAFKLGERTDLDVGYRYFTAPDASFAGRFANVETGSTPFRFDGDYVHQAVTVGLRFKFGAAAPAAAAPPPPPPPEPPQSAPPVQPVVCPESKFVIYFEWDRYNLNVAAIETIDKAVEAARACNVANVVLVGHTDTSGSNRYNQALSERRARVVREALVARGIAGEAIASEARGETDLAETTPDGVRNPRNRRTAVTITFR